MGSELRASCLAIDIGGTKTLFAVFDEAGSVIFEHKIPTPDDYNEFLRDTENIYRERLDSYNIKAVCCAVPAVELNRDQGIAISFGNLSWTNTPIKSDLEKVFQNTPVYIENDAKLAGLYEALSISGIKKLLYITIGTGMGIAIITNGVIDTSIGDAGGRGFMLDYEGKEVAWDDISSGRAIAKKYGKKASEISDPNTWKDYAKPLAKGLGILIGLTEPDTIVIGGGVGAHLDKFGSFLKEELAHYRTDKIKIPEITEAKKPEEAVIYGCYEYIKHRPEVSL